MTFSIAHRMFGFFLAALVAAAPAWADKPEWAGKGKEKHEKHGRDGRDDGDRNGGRDQRREVRVGAYFDDHQRSSVRHYYQQQYDGGRRGCPPGLAKKHNGCMPPGQAKKWAVGQSLPTGVVVYTVPQPVLVQLPPVPVGYKYVRVAGDILLVAAGTQMVVDGITGLLGN
jgi:Ni/Co efflux regulator RcnB